MPLAERSSSERAVIGCRCQRFTSSALAGVMAVAGEARPFAQTPFVRVELSDPLAASEARPPRRSGGGRWGNTPGRVSRPGP